MKDQIGPKAHRGGGLLLFVFCSVACLSFLPRPSIRVISPGGRGRGGPASSPACKQIRFFECLLRGQPSQKEGKRFPCFLVNSTRLCTDISILNAPGPTLAHGEKRPKAMLQSTIDARRPELTSSANTRRKRRM